MAKAAVAPPPQSRQRRSRSLEYTLIVAIVFLALSPFYIEHRGHNSVQNHKSEILNAQEGGHAPNVSSINVNTTGLTSGVGLITTDGRWDNLPADVSAKYDIKILAFTDKNYIPIAKAWYERLTRLGYKEHYIFTHEKETYDELQRQNYRVLLCFISKPDDNKHHKKGLFRQIMAARVKFARDLVKNGTHVLLTDIDNVFSRYVNPAGFVQEGYDVYHAYEMRFPLKIYNKHGFVFCGGHHFFSSTEATIRFLDRAVHACGEMCDDQIMFNNLFWKLSVEWEGGVPPSHSGAIRVEDEGINNGLLVESATGRCRETNHTFKIWDRDFAWRISDGIPDLCPSKHNWVGMPSMNGGGADTKISSKLALFDVWDDYCLHPEAEEKTVKIACNASVAGCSFCKPPMCKSCWTSQGGQGGKERICTILDAHAVAEDFFHEKDDFVKLKDGTTLKYCQSNKF